MGTLSLRLAVAMLAVCLAMAQEPRPTPITNSPPSTTQRMLEMARARRYTPIVVMGPLHVLHLDATKEDLAEGTSYGQTRAIRRVAFVANCDPFASILAENSIDEFQAAIDKAQSLLEEKLEISKGQIVSEPGYTYGGYRDRNTRMPYQSDLLELFEYCEPLYAGPFDDLDCNWCERKDRRRRADYPPPLKMPDRLKHYGPHAGPLRLRPRDSGIPKLKP